MAVTWNPWHGCRPVSPGCQNCYVYAMDRLHGRDSSQIYRTRTFDLPLAKDRQGAFKIPSGTLVYTCFTSDFFLEEADPWRPRAWEIIRRRRDLQFLFITKRIHRFWDCIPSDWGSGYPNVHIGCTAEDQQRAEERLPLFLRAPICRRSIACEPLLGPIDLSPYLGPEITEVLAGGESGRHARVCDFQWILDLRSQCIQAQVPFAFHQTGAKLKKDGRLYTIPRSQQHPQARRANVDWNLRDRGPIDWE